MKKYFFFLLAAVLSVVSYSCKKNNPVAVPSSSLTIVNALQDDDNTIALMSNFNSRTKLIYFSSADTIGFRSYQIYGGLKGQVPLAVYSYADSLHAIFNHTIQMEDNSIHTLFISGRMEKPDSLFTTDDIPRYPPQDSLLGIRFVNFFGGRQPVSINMQDDTGKTLVNKLAYNAISPFQSLSVKKTAPVSNSYVFEITDALTGELITTYTLSLADTRQSKSYTAVLTGAPGNPSVLLVSPAGR